MYRDSQKYIFREEARSCQRQFFIRQFLMILMSKSYNVEIKFLVKRNVILTRRI